MSLQTLQAAFAAATWPVTLNAAYLTAEGVTPPAGFDTLLAQGFALNGASGLSIGPGQVGAIDGDRFTITNATLTNGLFGATAANTGVRLTFTLPDDAGAVLLVQIEADLLGGWSFATGFAWMKGGAFSVLSFTRTSMLFSTATGTMIWPPNAASNVAVAPGMNFAGALTLDIYATTILQIANLAGAAVPNPLIMSGPFDASAVSDDVLFPVMSLTAPLSAASFSFLFLQATGPYFGFDIGPMPAVEAPPDDDTAPPEQPMSYVFGGQLATTTTPSLALDFSVLLQRGTNLYSVTLAPPPDDATPLTPADIATIAGVPASFIAIVPAPLQSFFTSIAFQGLNISALLPTGATLPVITATGVSVGTVEGFSYTLIDDPSGNFNLVIKSLDLHWTILNPGTAASRQMLLFSTSFTFMPTVFTDADGNPDGLFELSIDQDFTIIAQFGGEVSLANLLPAITGGLVHLPSGIAVSFSNVALLIDPTNANYSFSFEVDLEVDIISFGGKPLIQLQGMALALTASTPQNSNGPNTTTYDASMSGLLSVGPVGLFVDISYTGSASPPVWNLSTTLAAPLDLGTLLQDLFAVTDLGTFLPDFLPSGLMVETFSVTAVIPTGAGAQSKYTIGGSLNWSTEVLPGLPIVCTADLALAYDGSLASGSQFSGSVLGTISVDAVEGLTIAIGYAFNQPGSEGASVLTVQWEGITGTYNSEQQTITLTFDGWSLGSLVTSLVGLTGNPYFSLSGPWTFLNAVSLDGLSLTFYMKKDAPTTVSVNYTLPAKISLGFIVITGFNFNRDPVTGKILFSISGTSPLSDSSPEWKSLFSNDPAKGQDVTKLPEVPGQGNALFDLRLLALGQHISVNAANMNSTQDVIKSLEAIPGTTSGGANPVDPTTTASGQPSYSAQSNWLIALDVGLLGVKAGNSYTYTVDLMVVFNDPDLYGLRLAFNGEKAKILAGLAIDIMYKKVTATVGVYQLDFSFPAALRQLNFGAVNVTLPSISIAIYTNGDFMFDLGFPYNMDFSASFTVQAIVGPFPVMGSGGFYFGKLSNATATNIPATTLGTFDPVIEFGLGLQMGLGYSIDKGILSAGFSVTFFGIIQGVIAPWHPYSGSGGGSDVQSDNYFRLQGQFGIQGKLYGTVNFAIISASVSVSLQLAAQIVYQSYRAIDLSVSASVSVSVSVKIDLGLFSFSVSFSFATTISEDMTIGSNSQAPWDADPPQLVLLARHQRLGVPHTLARPALVTLSFAAFPTAANAELPSLTIVLSPQFTVLAPDVTQFSLAGQQGAFVALFAMDAPTADGAGNAAGSSFASLCAALLPWVIAAHPATAPAHLGATAMDDTPISIAALKEILATLADPANQPALAADDILGFLKSSFTVNIVTVPDATQQAALQAGAVLFPATPGLTLTVPSPTQSGQTITIDFANWTQITPAYRTQVLAAFDQLAAKLNNEINPKPPQAAPSSDAASSLAQVLFEDSFALIARQLLQAAIDSYAAFPYLLQADDSLQTIMNYVRGSGGDNNPHFSFADLVNGNAAAPLTAGNTLQFPGIVYTVQSADSLSAIAERYTDPAATPQFATTPAALIVANAGATALLQAGVVITVGTATTTTQLGDSFTSIATTLNIDLATLAAQTSLYGLTNLLLPAVAMAIPSIAYTTGASDTLGGLLTRFTTTTALFVGAPANLTVANIFDRQQDHLVQLCNLVLLTGTQLAQAVAAGETVGQTAGMLSRFMLQGLRLPNATGLTLPGNFLYPASQPQFGLYQLTGQQFPVTEYGVSYSVTLAKDAALDWVQINASAATQSGEADLTAAAANLKTVLNWAVANGYNPSAIDPPLTLATEPALTLVAQQFAASGYAPWATSGMAEIAALTTAAALQAVQETGGAGQVQPILWQLPPALLSQVETQQGALTQDMDLAAAIGYLPVLAPATLTTDPTTQTATLTAVEDFTFATRIDFQIRQLGQAAGGQTQTAASNTLLPFGPGNTPPVTELIPNGYQLIGPSPSDAQLLQRVLVQMEALGTGMVTGMLVGYSNASTGKGGLTGHAAGDVYSFVTRANLSTQANPPPMVAAMALELGVAATPETVNDFVNQPADLIRLMWELTTVQSGGYSFYWNALVNGAALPPGLFDASGYATLTLVVTYARSASLEPGARITDCCNAVLTASNIDPTRSTLVLVSQPAPNTAATA
jgi:hypothetical protein